MASFRHLVIVVPTARQWLIEEDSSNCIEQQ